MDTKILNDDLIEKCRNYLAIIFEKKISYEGSRFGRKIFNLNPNNLQDLKNEALEISKRINLYLPFVYWGPINMAKCGIEAEKSTIDIKKALLKIIN